MDVPVNTDKGISVSILGSRISFRVPLIYFASPLRRC